MLNGVGEYALDERNIKARFTAEYDNSLNWLKMIKVSQVSNNNNIRSSYDFYKSINIPFEHYNSAMQIKETVYSKLKSALTKS